MNNSNDLSNEEIRDTLDELSEYFDVLGNDTRLKILKVLQREPKEARKIAHILSEKWNLEVSIPNLKKHLNMLISIGVVTKYPIIRDDKQLVMYYKKVPRSLDIVLENLNVLGEYIPKATIGIESVINIDRAVTKILNEFPSISKLMLLDGENIIREFPLEKKCMYIGRTHLNHNNDITLPDTDLTVGRKQAMLIYESDKFCLKDIGSKNGTYLLDRHKKQFTKLIPNTPVELNDGDTIRFGLLNTTMIFRDAGE